MSHKILRYVALFDIIFLQVEVFIMLIESNKIELKSKYTDQIVKEIVAFINADGGKNIYRNK